MILKPGRLKARVHVHSLAEGERRRAEEERDQGEDPHTLLAGREMTRLRDTVFRASPREESKKI